MRTSFKLLAVATLLMPGCILVAKDGPDSSYRDRSSLERRVAELEAQMQHCQAMCEKSECKCMGAEKEHGDAGADHGAQPGAH